MSEPEQTTEAPPFLPAATLPKGGGAIRGIGEKFAVNPSRGTGTLTVPVFTTPGRSGSGPVLALSYDSGAGNSPFGLGFSLGLPTISRRTDKGLPRYTDSDTFVLAGAEDLVPSTAHPPYQDGDLRVRRFRPRTEAAFARIEQCTSTAGTFWRVTSADNVTSLFRATVADPDHPDRVYQWLLDEVRDDRGNIVRYEYRDEDLSGVDSTASFERNRKGPQPQRYLKAIRYGNRTPGGQDWCFHVIFDYGDHDDIAPALEPDRPWLPRPDAFSTYRGGFELRTRRLCRRVLMFHDLPGGELGDGPLPRLVRSTDLGHDDDPAGVRLISATQTGYLWEDGEYVPRSLPPVQFEYTRSEPEDVIRLVDAESIDNLPSGVDGRSYHWVDLDGEGINGALTSQGTSWFYKRNLGGARLGALQEVPLRPAAQAVDSPLALVDIGGDGARAIVHHGPRLSGYQERTSDGAWGPFTAFADTAIVDWSDPSLHQVDLDGDGLVDLLLTRGSEIQWHRGLGRKGFGEQHSVAHSRDEERAPVLIHSGQTEAVLLADMSGDGLADLVRVRESEVCYWPNLGHGRFGGKVAMAAPPTFENAAQFDPARLRLADMDGSGTTDVLYLGRDGVRLWRNLSGNRFGTAQTLLAPPVTDSLETAEVVDLLGTGTSCLVWSSPKAADQREPLRYVDLSRGVDGGPAGHKPNLLCLVRNNFGGLTRLTYAASTKFYLADRAAGRPWATRLAFPVHVVARVETEDLVAKTRTVSEYRYRHGYFDPIEREFRGFGMVEQTDAESFGPKSGELTQLHRDPVRTRTWFHTGAFLDEHIVSAQFADDYYDGDLGLADSVVDGVEVAAEHAQARRALAGQPLRVEVYADDGKSTHPYTVTETRYRVVREQACDEHRPAVFRSHPLETVTWTYDREPADPRVAHQIVLEVDQFNAVRRSASIGYPRKTPEIPEQHLLAVVLSQHEVRHTPAITGPYHLGVAVQAQSFEVTGLPELNGQRFTVSGLDTALTTSQQRLIEHVRTLYWDDNLVAPLALGQIGARALVHSTYKVAFAGGWLAQAMDGRVTESMLADEGRYVLWDGAWWMPSGVQVFDKAAFFLPRQLMDPFGNVSSVDYDPYLLLPVTTRASHQAPLDVLVTTLVPDYRVMAARMVTDPNGSRSRARFDALGRVTATWVNGVSDVDGDPADKPGIRFTYGESSWLDGHGPVWALVETREEHGGSTFQRARVYTDGSGRVAMTKAQAEPGLAWTTVDGVPVQVDASSRWIGSGRTVFDNKGKPVKQYEPYFSVNDGYEDEAGLVEQGVTAVMHYDPIGRLVRTEHPDGTLSRVTFGSWRQEAWDVIDTVKESLWYAERGSPLPTDPEPATPEGRAAWLAAHHATTPTVSHLDTLGRVVRVEADGGTLGTFLTITAFDIEGNTISVTDARDIVVLQQEVDLAGRVLHTHSPDAGDRWTLPDIAGRPIRSWDSRGQSFCHTYDLLRRPVALWADSTLVSLTYYGEAHANATDRNLRGRAYLTFDGAGLNTAMRYDFKGNLTVGRRRLAATFPTPNWAVLDGQSLSDAESLASALLQDPVYASATEFDALNRPKLHVLPDTTVVEPTYGEGGALETVAVKLPGQTSGSLFVTSLDYDAKGQRMGIAYGNGVTTSYEYDPRTYRLTRLLTLRGASSDVLQDLRYTYDPAGNVVEIRDEAQQTHFFAGQVVSPSARYIYDALGRLASASGREHASLGVQPDSSSPSFQPVPHPNDINAVRLYTQSYGYDAVGNLLSLVHAAGAGSYTRTHDISPTSNRLMRHSLPGGVSTPDFAYDEHGNLLALSGQAMSWDYADRLSTVDLGGGGTAYYCYDGSGQRVRKVLVRNGGLVEERVYLGGFEEHTRRLNGALTFQRTTAHVMDDVRRIALVETLVVGDTPGTRVRYQLDNHLGSCALEVSDSAEIVSYEEYHPYGTTSLWLGAAGVEVSDRRYRYTGKERDEETGLYYHGARYYIPWLARWSSPDPSGLVDGTNRYLYVHARPTIMVDPSGNEGRTISGSTEVTVYDKNGKVKSREVTLSVVEIEGERPKTTEELAVSASGTNELLASGDLEVIPMSPGSWGREAHLEARGGKTKVVADPTDSEMLYSVGVSIATGFSAGPEIGGVEYAGREEINAVLPYVAIAPLALRVGMRARATYHRASGQPGNKTATAPRIQDVETPEASQSKPLEDVSAPSTSAPEIAEDLLTTAAEAGVAPGHLRKNPIEVLVVGDRRTVATISPKIFEALKAAGVEERLGVVLLPPQPKRVSIVLGTPLKNTVHGGTILFDDLVKAEGAAASRATGETASVPIRICDECSMQWDLIPGIKQSPTTPMGSR